MLTEDADGELELFKSSRETADAAHGPNDLNPLGSRVHIASKAVGFELRSKIISESA